MGDWVDWANWHQVPKSMDDPWNEDVSFWSLVILQNQEWFTRSLWPAFFTKSLCNSKQQARHCFLLQCKHVTRQLGGPERWLLFGHNEDCVLFLFTHTARGLDCWMLYAWHKQHNSRWSGLYIWCFTSLCVEEKHDFMWATSKNGGKNQPLFEESCQTSEVVPNNPSQNEILPGRLFIFL